MKLGFNIGVSYRKKGFEKYSKPIEEEYFTLDVSKLDLNKLK